MANTEDNLRIYNLVRKVPQEALKTISAGNLKGMSDINPQFRIMAMTQAFGICGIGWKYEITKQWTETYGNEVKCFTNINVYVRDKDNNWSDPIPGTGGSSIVQVFSSRTQVNDEGYKMSLTDALGVAMKALGVAADVYFQKGARFGTKYEQAEYESEQAKQASKPAQKPVVNSSNIEQAKADIAAAKSIDELTAIWNKYPDLQPSHDFTGALTAKKDLLNGGNKK